MPFTTDHLQQHPLSPGIVGALSLAGYQLLSDVAGIGAARLGSQIFLLAAPEQDQGLPDVGTQLVLHETRLRNDAQAAPFVQLSAQLGYLRLSGYRVALERAGLRSKLSLVNPATGAIALRVPEKQGGGLLRGGGSRTASGLLVAARALPQAGSPPDLRDPQLMYQTVLALALADDSLGGQQAAELADRAVTLSRSDASLDPVAALRAAREA